MKKHTLNANTRDIKTSKTAMLRREGIIPATVYGKMIQSESLSMKLADFVKVYGEAKETGLVELHIGESTKPVLIHNVQRDPVKDIILHVEFHQVDLKEKVHANIPLVFVGEAPAVSQKLGVILNLLSEVEVEALPTDLPEKLDVDISHLSVIDEELKVSDIQIPQAVTLLTDGSVVVAKVGELVSKAAEEQAAAEAAASEAAAPTESESPAGGAPAADGDGDKKVGEDKKSEEK